MLICWRVLLCVCLWLCLWLCLGVCLCICDSLRWRTWKLRSPLCVCLSVYDSVCVSMCLSVYMWQSQMKDMEAEITAVCLSVCLCVYVSVFMSDSLRWRTWKLRSLQCMCLSVCESVCDSVCESVCDSVYVSVSVCLTVSDEGHGSWDQCPTTWEGRPQLCSVVSEGFSQQQQVSSLVFRYFSVQMSFLLT